MAVWTKFVPVRVGFLFDTHRPTAARSHYRCIYVSIEVKRTVLGLRTGAHTHDRFLGGIALAAQAIPTIPSYFSLALSLCLSSARLL